MKRTAFLLFLTTLFVAPCGIASAFRSPLKVGWVIGWDEDNAVILHTRNGGRKWLVQCKIPGCVGNDISAVDNQTAWAALGSTDGEDGSILHTTNGGRTWISQALPEGVGAVKGIKGLTRLEAWAVSLTGTILHTTDGGKVWIIVEHPDFTITQVNRMDAIGYRELQTDRPAARSRFDAGRIYSNIWVVDEHGADDGRLGMIHSLYNGEIWRRESIPCQLTDCQVHMVSAYSPRVVWAAAWFDGTLYRTEDGGETWNPIEAGIGPNDIDDMCAYSAEALWLVQFQGTPTGAGDIYHVRLEEGTPQTERFSPVDQYKYEGLTCVDEKTVCVVGYTDVSDPSFQRGIILTTNDGGGQWVRHPLPLHDASFWKVSFVGARR